VESANPPFLQARRRQQAKLDVYFQAGDVLNSRAKVGLGKVDDPDEDFTLRRSLHQDIPGMKISVDGGYLLAQVLIQIAPDGRIQPLAVLTEHPIHPAQRIGKVERRPRFNGQLKS